MIKEAIILAGGLGTRLRSVLPDLPKCMAPVAGKPFLHYIIQYLNRQGIAKFTFSLGYKYELIEKYLLNNYLSLNYQLSIEEEPLGTGGAVKLACKKATEKNVFILNGDTFFSVDINTIGTNHIAQHADCTLALKPMENFDRYGAVVLNNNNRITSFKEKQFYQEGLINGGIYLLNIQSFLQLPFPEKFSFEKDYLEQYCTTKNIFGVIQSKLGICDIN